jgi:hypothetical protein
MIAVVAHSTGRSRRVRTVDLELFEGPASGVRLSDVLCAWRAAERELAHQVEGSPTWIRLQAATSDLRSLYGRLFDARSGSLQRDAATRGSPMPPGDGGSRP